MGEIIKAIKLIPSTILQWHEKQLKEEDLLEQCQKVIDTFHSLKVANDRRDSEAAAIHQDIKDLKKQMSVMTLQLGATTEGIKKELSETIHQWHEKAVMQGYLSYTEKREVEEIFRIYSEELKGNGLGKHYYDEIMKLPDE